MVAVCRAGPRDSQSPPRVQVICASGPARSVGSFSYWGCGGRRARKPTGVDRSASATRSDGGPAAQRPAPCHYATRWLTRKAHRPRGHPGHGRPGRHGWEATNANHATWTARAVAGGKPIPRNVQRREPDPGQMWRRRKQEARARRHGCRIDEKVQHRGRRTSWPRAAPDRCASSAR